MLDAGAGARVRGEWLPQVAAAGLVDKRFGPVLEFSWQRLGESEPPWFLATTAVARHPIGALHNEVALTSAGTSLSAEEAQVRALGEAIERYSALNALVPFERATLREGGFAGRWPVAAPDEPCSPQFRSLPLDVPLTQVRMRRLGDGASVLAPAGFVSLDFHPLPPEPPVTLPISTGLAFHPERHQAIWRGLCEVIERDAVMSAWWLHRSLAEIDITDAPFSVISRLDRLKACGMTARLYDITTELGVPTAFSVLQAHRYPHLVVGAASRASAEAAIAKALDEVVSMRVALKVDAPTAKEPDLAPPVTLVGHARWHAGGNRDGAFDFLFASGLAPIPYQRFAQRSIAEPADMAELDHLARRFGIEDLPILWVELTAPEMRALGSVVRVVVPGLVPLSPDDRIRWLGTKRLIKRAGLQVATRTAFAGQPHPFA
ncbi:MAG: YcaO-like family protein [Acetobacteraceae bacterium]